MDHTKKQSGHVNSLAKGLSVLAATNELAPARISKLVEMTSLPKPTLIRLLKTLVAEGYVINRPKTEGGGYIPSPKVRILASAFAKAGALGQTAQPFLNNLSETIKWPTDLLVRDGLSMLIESSNRDIAPITLKRFEQKRFPLLGSSAGQAFLAWQPENERNEIVTATLALKERSDNEYLSVEQLDVWIKEIRVRGYAMHNYDAPIDGTRVFSIPLLREGRSIAVLTLVTLRDILSLESFEQNILSHLNVTAEKIVEEFILQNNVNTQY